MQEAQRPQTRLVHPRLLCDVVWWWCGLVVVWFGGGVVWWWCGLVAVWLGGGVVWWRCGLVVVWK